ncbi:MAG: hypothetical protein QM719_11730 [Thermomonas sp.]
MGKRNARIALLALGLWAIAGCGRTPAQGEAADVADAGRPVAPVVPLPTQAEQAPAGAVAATEAMQPATIADLQTGEPVAIVMLPAGWRSNGGLAWNRGTPCVGNQMQFQWEAASPDGSTRLAMLPGLAWQVQGAAVQFNPCPVLPIRGARDFLQAYAQRARPDARIVEYRDMSATLPQGQGGMQPNGARTWSEAGELVLSRAQGGAEVREVLSALVSFSQVQNSLVANTGYVGSYSAPADRLDPEFARRIRASLEMNKPYWEVAVQRGKQSADAYGAQQGQRISAWHNARMAEINARGAAQRAAISAQGMRDVAAINSATAADTAATSDRMHRETMEGIGGYETYRDASGNQVQADMNYDRVLQTGDGQYVGTNDPYYNPAGSSELQVEP